MAIFHFSIDAIDCLTSASGSPDVVLIVYWTRHGSDGANTVARSGSTQLNYASGQSFTPFGDLTEEQVIGWVTSALGSAEIGALDASMGEQLAAIASPPVISAPLPWATE